MTAARGEEQATGDPDTRRVEGLKGRWSAVAMLVAALWCIGLVVAAATLPVYTSTTTTADGPGAAEVTAATTETLLQVNGVGVLVVVALPLAAVAVVAAALARRRRRHMHGAGPVAWIMVGMLAALAILGILSIGVFIAPAVVLLAIACVTASPSTRAT